jgi:hypothetical protein
MPTGEAPARRRANGVLSGRLEICPDRVVEVLLEATGGEVTHDPEVRRVYPGDLDG